MTTEAKDKLLSAPDKFIVLTHALRHVLRVDGGRCVLVGSAALAIRNIRDVNDLDVIVDQELFELLCARARTLVDAEKVVAFEYDHDKLAVQTSRGVIQISTDFYNFAKGANISVEELGRDADRWFTWAVISLPHFKRFKTAMGRMKDLEDLELLKQKGL